MKFIYPGKKYEKWPKLKKDKLKEMFPDKDDSDLEYEWYRYDLDHKIPYVLCGDSSKENLILLTIEEHQKKTAIDLKIIKQILEEGLIEKVFTYYEPKADIKVIAKRYMTLFKNYNVLSKIKQG